MLSIEIYFFFIYTVTYENGFQNAGEKDLPVLFFFIHFAVVNQFASFSLSDINSIFVSLTTDASVYIR